MQNEGDVLSDYRNSNKLDNGSDKDVITRVKIYVFN